MNQEILDQINVIIPKENILGDEPMSRHTTFRTGGPADYFIRISSKDELSKLITVLKKENIDFFVTGNGSNLLVSDNGYHGVIISMSGLDTLQVDGNRILAGAGVLNSKVGAGSFETFTYRNGSSCRYSGICRRMSSYERRRLRV